MWIVNASICIVCTLNQPLSPCVPLDPGKNPNISFLRFSAIFIACFFWVHCTTPPSNYIFYQKMAKDIWYIMHSPDYSTGQLQIQQKILQGGAPSRPCDACDVLLEQGGLNCIVCCDANPIEIPVNCPQMSPKHSST